MIVVHAGGNAPAFLQHTPDGTAGLRQIDRLSLQDGIAVQMVEDRLGTDDATIAFDQ